MIWDTAAERAYARQICTLSFWAFLTYCFGAPDRKRKHAWFSERDHKPLADWFEYHIREWLAWRESGEAPRQKKLAVIVPRRVGKTTCITQAGAIWLHLQDPELAVGIGSEDLEQAQKIYSTVAKVIGDEPDPYAKFNWLYGNWHRKNKYWTKSGCVHGVRKDIARKEPSFFVWGVNTGLTSSHNDVLILDDPTSYDILRANSSWLDVVNEHTDTLIPVLESDGLLIYVGTRYGDGDHFGRSFKYDGIRSVAGMPLPSGTPSDDGEWDVYFLSGRDALGRPALPNIWSESAMSRFKKKNPLWYASQVENDPTKTAFNPLSMADIEALIVEDNLVPYTSLRYTLHLDTAFKRQEKQYRGDESVWQMWGHTTDGSGVVYFVEGDSSNAWSAQQFADTIVTLLQRYRRLRRKVIAITDEPEIGREGLWETYLTDRLHEAGLYMPGGKMTLVNKTPQKKVPKIIESSAFWKDQYVRLPRNAPGLHKLVTQMSHIGSGAHDDWADCQTGVFHKDIYNPLHRTLSNRSDEDDTDDLRRPWDNILKDWRERGSEYRERLLSR